MRVDELPARTRVKLFEGIETRRDEGKYIAPRNRFHPKPVSKGDASSRSVGWVRSEGGDEKRLEGGKEARDATRGAVGLARVSFRARRFESPALVCIQTHPTPAYLNRVRATERPKPREDPRRKRTPSPSGRAGPSGASSRATVPPSSRETRDAIRSIPKNALTHPHPRVWEDETRGALFAARSCRGHVYLTQKARVLARG